MISKTTRLLGLLLGLALGLAPAARAQTDFRPGYVVLPAGDTLRGEVDFRGARRNSQRCQFRAAATAAVQQLRPGVLRAYGYRGGDAYRTALVPLPDSAGRLVPARFFFLRVLADGPATLYARRDAGDASYYYLQKADATNQPVAELTHRQEQAQAGPQLVIREFNDYQKTLAAAFADCLGVQAAVSSAAFGASALTAVVEQYNQCRQPQAVPRRIERVRGHLAAEVLGGSFGSRLVYDYGPGLTENCVAPLALLAGAALELASPSFNPKVSLRLEALLSQQRYAGESDFVANPSSTGRRQVRLQSKQLRLPVLVRYTLRPGRAVRPFVEAGVVVGQLWGVAGEYRYRTSAGQTYREPEQLVDNYFSKVTEFGLMAGAGLRLAAATRHPVSLLGRVEKSGGEVANSGLLRYYLLVSFNLIK